HSRLTGLNTELMRQSHSGRAAQRHTDLTQELTQTESASSVSPHCSRKSFCKDPLSTAIGVTEEAARPELYPNRNALPGQVTQMTSVPAVDLRRSSPTKGTGLAVAGSSQNHHEQIRPVQFQRLQNHLAGIGHQGSSCHGPDRRTARTCFFINPNSCRREVSPKVTESLQIPHHHRHRRGPHRARRRANRSQT